MSFFKNLSSLFKSKPDASAYWVRVKCSRCEEIIQARINLYNDLSLDYEGSGKSNYYCRKTLMGEGRCFQRVEVELTFNDQRRLIERKISGGQFVDEA